jgi:hypothetical protein
MDLSENIEQIVTDGVSGNITPDEFLRRVGKAVEADPLAPEGIPVAIEAWTARGRRINELVQAARDHKEDGEVGAVIKLLSSVFTVDEDGEPTPERKQASERGWPAMEYEAPRPRRYPEYDPFESEEAVMARHAVEVLTEIREHIALQGVEAVSEIIDAMIAEREALIPDPIEEDGEE